MAGATGWDVLNLILQSVVGVGGVLLGAKIASKNASELQEKELRQADRRNAALERSRLRALCFTTLMRYADIYSSVTTLRKHLRARVHLAVLHGARMYQALQPLGPLPVDVWVTDDDRRAVFEIGGEALLHMLAILPERRNAFVAAFAHYNKDRDDLQQAFPEVVLGGPVALPKREEWMLNLRIEDLDRRAVWLVEEVESLHRDVYLGLVELRAKYESRFEEKLASRVINPPE